MSQTGTIVSIGPILWNQEWNWSVIFSYQLDAGGTQQAQVFVGQPHPQHAVLGLIVVIASWTSPTGTITVTPNPPGTTNPVVLPCPPIVKAATFGLPWV